tara:strand:- start:7119 stop:7328 length:210 start_codon:yes stop_codon:yes gene_type:complete
MYSYFFGKYYYQYEILSMINVIEEDRKQQRLQGKVMSTSFSDDLKILVITPKEYKKHDLIIKEEKIEKS